MFGIVSSLARAAVGVVTTPVAVLRDAAEVVGLADDSRRNYTGEALTGIVKNLENAVKPKG